MAEEIIREIKWTDSARISFHKIIEYILREWSEREVEKFIASSDTNLSVLEFKTKPREI